MRTLFRTGLMLSAMGLAAAAPPAEAASRFDGVYVGVSASNGGDTRCLPTQTPSPLTIANGTATSATGFFTGTVDANGHVVLHTKESTHFEGQIDPAGVLSVSGGTGHCNYVVTWKKR